jgi:peptidoglycan/xylan/chitin deacetylase (PgdA/CDA1 family)
LSDRVLHSRFGLPVLLLVIAIFQALAVSTCAPEGAPRPTPAPDVRATLTSAPHGRARVLTPATATATPMAGPTATPSPSPTATETAALTDTPTAKLTATAAATLAPTVPVAAATAEVERTARVPILMYHYVSDPPADADRVRVDLSVTPRRFEEQLRYLKDAGYTCVSLSDLVRYLQEGTPLPPNPVVLTFDDGYVDNYLYAFPLLRQYGFRGTFFVITGFLDEQRHGYLSWEQAATMEENGMDVEPHSYTHTDLRGRSVDYLVWQIEGSREAIEAHLHKTAAFFCYPAGRYDAQTIAVLRSAHFQAAVTTNPGSDHTTSGLLELTRVRVHGGDAIEKFGALMEYYR